MPIFPPIKSCYILKYEERRYSIISFYAYKQEDICE